MADLISRKGLSAKEKTEQVKIIYPTKPRRFGPKPELCKQQHDDLALAFGLFDPRGKGTVPPRTLLLSLRAMTKDVDYHAVEAMIGEAGYSKDEDIDFKRFHHIMEADMLEDDSPAEVEMAFKLISSNKKGITVEDLKHVADELESDVSKDEIVEMIKCADLNKSGSVSFKQFKKILERPILE